MLQCYYRKKRAEYSEKACDVILPKSIFAAAGSTPNLDMKFIQGSLDPVFRADLCIVEIEILCLSRCRNSGGGDGRAECEKNIELRAHIASFYILQSAPDLHLTWIMSDLNLTFGKYEHFSKKPGKYGFIYFC